MERFNCYSQRLFRALIDNGFTPLYLKPIDENTICVVFEKTETLVAFVKNTYQTVRDKY